MHSAHSACFMPIYTPTGSRGGGGADAERHAVLADAEMERCARKNYPAWFNDHEREREGESGNGKLGLAFMVLVFCLFLLCVHRKQTALKPCQRRNGRSSKVPECNDLVFNQ